MKWSLKVARIAGIDVKVHWTFAILLVWLATANLARGQDISQSLLGIVFVLAIFGCVLLHEFGHALVAKRFGVKTPDITLLPIGGVARLERIPEEPNQELLIAIAGPLVNVVIAGILFAVLWFTNGLVFPDNLTPIGSNFLLSLLFVNVVLVLFNMIPAFPMDGGRVLRALLAQNMDYVRATEIAANVGQVIAIGFGIVGLFSNWFLIFIALFVYLGAQGESHFVLTRSLLKGVRVSDAMMTRFVSVSPQDPISVLIDELLAGDQQDFPVLQADRVIGMVRREDLIKSISEGMVDAPIESITHRDCRPVDENAMLRDTFESMLQSTCQTLPVLRDGQLVGLLSQDNIGEWLMIRSAMRGANVNNRAIIAQHQAN